MELLQKVAAWTGQPWVQAAAAKATSFHADSRSQKDAGNLAQQIEYCLPIHRQRAGVPELEPIELSINGDITTGQLEPSRRR
jgi:hypothetical protein